MTNTVRRILIVEDEPLMAQVVSRILGDQGASIVTAGSVSEAEALIDRETFDIVILDRMLPDGDGLQIFKKLRASPALKNLPVLVLSGKTAPEDQMDGLNLGADDYILKPFSHLELKARVEALIRRSHKFSK